MCLKHHPFEKRRQKRPIFEMQRCIEKHYHIWFFGLESFPCIQMVFCIPGNYQNFLFSPSNESKAVVLLKNLAMFSNLKSETAFTLKSISDSSQVKHCQIEKKSAAHQRAHQHLASMAVHQNINKYFLPD